MADSRIENELLDVTSSFQHFLTNQGDNTLENKLQRILKKGNIEYIDFLIGYFRITGFHRIENYLDGIKKTRILVGINIDRATFEAKTKVQNIAILSKEQIDCFNESNEPQKHHSINQLIKLLAQPDKFQVRITPTKDVHAKFYILREDQEPNNDTYGSVIIGSSNLTYNGLVNHLEINTELNSSSHIDEATKIFNILWSHSVELTQEDVEKQIIPYLKDYKPKTDTLTPYQLYIKLLIEHFGKRINYMDGSDITLPNEFKKLSYQVEAVNDGVNKLQEHNGFFLSDVVGLGKTVVVAMIIKRLKSRLKKRILVVIPPAVKVQWQDTLKLFDIGCCDIVSLAGLEKVKAQNYELIVVDESHKFKNRESKRYKQLANITLNKKVMLLSATPKNNTPSDLFNQIALFANIKHSTIPTCRNLQSFFNIKEQEYKKLINETPINKEALEALSIDIRDKVLRPIMIRRTRYDIEHHDMYKDDIKAQGLDIPKVNAPIEHEYQLKGELGTLFDTTAKHISQNLHYARFNLLHYLTDEAKKRYYPDESPNIFKKNPLAHLMKTLLIKRFESSFSAFKISIKRHKQRYEEFIKNYNNDIIYLGEKATDILDYNEEDDGDYEEFIDKLIQEGRVKQLQRSDFDSNLKDLLDKDYKIFEALLNAWKDITQDPKVEHFKKELQKYNNQKIVVFTESVDTLNYLQKELNDIPKILFINSQNREENKTKIKENFDANYDLSKQKDDYTIIITTDTLAEGINLHRSHTIFNYDIPWNATKLIQRIGRVNRIGTRAEFIDIHNFKPASHIDNLIELSQKAFVKLQSSHTMMGEDNQIYTQNETVSSVSLFEQYQEASKERDEELDYLQELRLFRDANPQEFERISKLSTPLTLSRKSKHNRGYVALSLNNQNRYYYLQDSSVTPISFVEFAHALQATPDERAIQADESSATEYLSKVTKYLQAQHHKEMQEKAEGIIDDKASKNALAYLKEWMKDKIIDRELFEKYKDAMRKGEIGIVTTKEIIALKNLSESQKIEALDKIIAKRQKAPKLFDESLIIHPILSQQLIKE